MGRMKRILLPALVLGLIWPGTLMRLHGEEDPEAEEPSRRPGLVARYVVEGEMTPRVVRLDASPALLLASGEAPDPRLPARGWRAEWRGVLEVLRPGSYRF